MLSRWSYEPERIYLLRMGLRILIIALVTLFIAQQYFGFATAIGGVTFVLYAASAVFRRRNEVSDALPTPS